MGQIVEELNAAQCSDFSLDIRVACSRIEVLYYLASIIGQSTGSSVLSPVSIKGEMREEADAYLVQVFFGFEYSNLSQFFHSDGAHNFFSYTNPQVDKMLSQLDEVSDMTVRRRIGRRGTVPTTRRFCDDSVGTLFSLYPLITRNPVRLINLPI